MFVYNRKVLPLPKEVLNMFREGRKFSYPQTCFMTSMFGEKMPQNLQAYNALYQIGQSNHYSHNNCKAPHKHTVSWRLAYQLI